MLDLRILSPDYEVQKSKEDMKAAVEKILKELGFVFRG